ncbi:hypothetical protein KIW84_052777 [Lathyrus oleraceus]|uniref:Uncharacterized protein n=1 Tax=Pisum sativum TaxID=3888 RepID=A0A9D5ACE9_PEA|nr:hypothetical protein KIW84_052777 [Pisum sativum]
MFGIGNLCWMSANAISEASKLAEFLVLQTGCDAHVAAMSLPCSENHKFQGIITVEVSTRQSTVGESPADSTTKSPATSPPQLNRMNSPGFYTTNR